MKKTISMKTLNNAQEEIEKSETIKIAIVDDAFDDVFNGSEEDKRSFWNDINNDRLKNYDLIKSDFDDFNSTLSQRIEDISQLTDENLAILWKQKKGYTNLHPLIIQLFNKKVDEILPLEQIFQAINECCEAKNTKCEINKFPSDLNIKKDLEDVDLVFLDYFMPDDTSASQYNTQKSEEIASQIYEHFSTSKLPVLVLMSSSPKVLESQSKFRKNTGWLKGLFYCSPKKNLEGSDEINLYMILLDDIYKDRVKINEFVKAITLSLEKNRENFVDLIQDIGLEDYIYVSHFSLKQEGQPLGEYMLWLFKCQLEKIIFEDDKSLCDKRSEIDKIQFESLPLLPHYSPSMNLVAMYHGALFNNNLENVENHPLQVINNETKIKYPYLKQGMVFANKNGEKKVWMIINAECDLIFNPLPSKNSDSVQRPPIDIVTLIEGNLYKILDTIERESHDTEFFNFDGASYIIKWNWKNTRTFGYKDVLEDLKKEEFEPVAILRSPYVLKVQQHYSTQFSRIGLPVAPPLYKEIKVEVFGKINDEIETFLSPTENLASWIINKSNSECQFMPLFASELKRCISEFIQKHKMSLEEGKQLTRKIQNMEDNIDSIIEDFPQNFKVRFKSKNSISYFKDKIGIFKDVNKHSFDEWGEYFLIINLIDENVETEVINE